jgi:hypothetical protein
MKLFGALTKPYDVPNWAIGATSSIRLGYIHRV